MSPQKESSQIEKLRKVSNAVIIPINTPTRHTLTHRYQVYVDWAGQMVPLYPLYPSKDKLLKYQIRHRYHGLPRFHFAIKGHSSENVFKIKEMLTKTNPKLKVSYLNGW